MEEKLLELIKTAIEVEQISEKKYVEVHLLRKNRLEVDIRDKNTFEYIQTTEIDLKEDIFSIEDIIAKLNKLKEEEE